MRIQFGSGKENAFLAWNALRTAREGETLFLGGGEIHFYPQGAYGGFYRVSNNESSMKAIAFPIVGKRGITVDGEGARLIFHGFISPFVLDGSTDITLKNFSVNYARPFFSQAEVTEAGEDVVRLRFPKEFPTKVSDGGLEFFSPEDGWTTGRINRILVTAFDRESRAPSGFDVPYLADFNPNYEPDFLSGMVHRSRAEENPDGTITLRGVGVHHKGDWFVATHGFRRSSGILIQQSSGVLVENVDLFHTEGMGVVGQFSENITLRRVRAIPEPGSGRLLSVSADATHFVHCTGTLELDSCTFTHMLDDAFNCHGNYTKLFRRLDGHSVLVQFGHEQHLGLPLYRPGDRLTLVRQDDLVSVGSYTLSSVQSYSPELLLLNFEEPLPEDLSGLAVANYDRMPELWLHDCVTGWNRPRGFLISTGKKTVIERCRFTNQYCAVHLTGDAADWYESGPVGDLVIRDNDFDNSAYLGGAVICIEPHLKTRTEHTFHENILIENNRFRLAEPRFLKADHARNLIFRNNVYTQDPTLPSHPFSAENGLEVSDCKETVAEPCVKA